MKYLFRTGIPGLQLLLHRSHQWDLWDGRPLLALHLQSPNISQRVAALYFHKFCLTVTPQEIVCVVTDACDDYRQRMREVAERMYPSRKRKSDNESLT